MDTVIKGALSKIAISLAFLWFHSPRDGDWMKLFFYDRDLETTDPRLKGRRITITVEIEDNPHWSAADDQR